MYVCPPVCLSHQRSAGSAEQTKNKKQSSVSCTLCTSSIYHTGREIMKSNHFCNRKLSSWLCFIEASNSIISFTSLIYYKEEKEIKIEKYIKMIRIKMILIVFRKADKNSKFITFKFFHWNKRKCSRTLYLQYILKHFLLFQWKNLNVMNFKFLSTLLKKN